MKDVPSKLNNHCYSSLLEILKRIVVKPSTY